MSESEQVIPLQESPQGSPPFAVHPSRFPLDEESKPWYITLRAATAEDHKSVSDGGEEEEEEIRAAGEERTPPKSGDVDGGRGLEALHHLKPPILSGFKLLRSVFFSGFFAPPQTRGSTVRSVQLATANAPKI
nr:hypothetical protein Iba_chr03fCG3700 [Ipomoea batatas]